jgi:hypothetical protein
MKFKNMKVLNDVVLDYSNPFKMFELAKEYDKLKQGAAAFGWYLRAADFFAIDSIPKASFVITASVKDEENENYYKVTGDLTIRVVSNPIEFPAMVYSADGQTKIKANFAFDRTAYGIEYGSKSMIGKLAGKFIYDEIELSLKGIFESKKTIAE